MSEKNSLTVIRKPRSFGAPHGDKSRCKCLYKTICDGTEKKCEEIGKKMGAV